MILLNLALLCRQLMIGGVSNIASDCVILDDFTHVGTPRYVSDIEERARLSNGYNELMLFEMTEGCAEGAIEPKSLLIVFGEGR